jgi:preprotein translocase SecE subunit
MPMRPRRRRLGILQFLLEVVDQLLQVLWPARRVLRHNSAVIFGTVAVIAACITALDFAFGGAFTQLLGHH